MPDLLCSRLEYVNSVSKSYSGLPSTSSDLSLLTIFTRDALSNMYYLYVLFNLRDRGLEVCPKVTL